MSHHGSESQQIYNQAAFNGSSTVAIEQGNNLIVNPSMSMQNSAVALGIVHQQQMPMLWKGQAPLVPNPGTNVSNINNNQLPGPFAAIVPSNGIIPMNTQVDPVPPIAPGSAPNIILASAPINNLENNTSRGRKASTVSKSKAKGSKGDNTAKKTQIKDHDDVDGKTEKNRERNREHARSTRLRKKAYIQKLKDMAHGLRAVQTKDIRERRSSMQDMMSIQKVRRSTVQTVLNFLACNEKDPAKWNALLESSFWMKEPITPFRSFPRSEIVRDCRIVRGVYGMICDAASMAVMIERVGCDNARWQRIKRGEMLQILDDRDVLTQEMGIAQQPESSLSSESSSDSLHCLGVKNTTKRKRSSYYSELSKVSLSSESGKTPEINNHTSSDTNTNTSSSDEDEKETSTKSTFRPHKVGRKGNGTCRPPILNSAYLNRVNAEPISAFYAVNQDDMIILEDVLMCPFVFRTKNAVLCGALADCVIPGMLRATFSKNNKLLNLELIFDAMGFIQQLDSANGDASNAQAIPNSLETALHPCPDEARVITEATPPYSIVHVNDSWTRMTNYSQIDVEGSPLLALLQNDNAKKTVIRSGRPSHNLEDVQRGQPGCSTCVHHNKDGKPFVDFMCSYPLTNTTELITHMLHVNMELPVTLIS